MADNVTVQSDAPASAAAGTVFAFDEIGGVKHARSKTGFGADGSYTDVSASDPLPVVQTGTPALPSGAATSANQTTLIGHVDGIEGLLTTIDADTSALAAAVSGSKVQVDVVTAPTTAVTGTFWQATQPVSAAALPLPSGASTLAEQQTQTTAIGATNETAAASDTATAGLNGRLQRIAQRLTSLIAILPTSLGQKTKANSLAVAIASDQDTLPVSLASVPSHAVTNAGTFAVQAAQSGTWNVTNVSGTVSLPTGAATLAEQQSQTTHLSSIATSVGTLDNAIAGSEMQVDVVGSLPAGTNAIGKLAANSGVDIGDVDVLSTVQPTANTQAAVTSVADTATSTTLLSSSGTRKGFRITNTSSAVLYVKYGTTASATDFTARLPQWAYLEENFFSGRVDGIWASDPGDGAALITSLSA